MCTSEKVTVSSLFAAKYVNNAINLIIRDSVCMKLAPLKSSTTRVFGFWPGRRVLQGVPIPISQPKFRLNPSVQEHKSHRPSGRLSCSNPNPIPIFYWWFFCR